MLVYINEIIISPISLSITFKLPSTYAIVETSFLLNSLASSLGAAITSVENVPIKIHGIKMENMFEPISFV